LDDEGRLSSSYKAKTYRGVQPHNVKEGLNSNGGKLCKKAPVKNCTFVSTLLSLEKIVIIPTYNEKENIANIIQAIFYLKENFHILVIDDSSPDGTADIVRKLQSKYPIELYLEERKGKLGLGTAYIYGFKWAVERDFRYIFEMDADFSHNPKDLRRLYEACKIGGADVAIGSRYIKGGGTVNWPKDRIFLSKGGSLSRGCLLKTPLPVSSVTKRKSLKPLISIRFAFSDMHSRLK
jgi:glycosyltransferase involved in cell wall biosynthesis